VCECRATCPVNALTLSSRSNLRATKSGRPQRRAEPNQCPLAAAVAVSQRHVAVLSFLTLRICVARIA
jgi:hypothetical protein